MSALPPKADILSVESMSAMCQKRTFTKVNGLPVDVGGI